MLEREVAQLIIDSLNLEDVSVDDIDPQAPLFRDGLGWIRSMHWNWRWRFHSSTVFSSVLMTKTMYGSSLRCVH